MDEMQQDIIYYCSYTRTWCYVYNVMNFCHSAPVCQSDSMLSAINAQESYLTCNTSAHAFLTALPCLCLVLSRFMGSLCSSAAESANQVAT